MTHKTKANEGGIEDSIVLGFDIYLESVKKATNSDIIAAITSADQADATFTKVTQAHFSNDPNAQVYNMSDEGFREIWQYTHDDVKKWAKENIKDFKQTPLFYTIMGEIKKNPNFAYTKRLDNQNATLVLLYGLNRLFVVSFLLSDKISHANKTCVKK